MKRGAVLLTSKGCLATAAAASSVKLLEQVDDCPQHGHAEHQQTGAYL